MKTVSPDFESGNHDPLINTIEANSATIHRLARGLAEHTKRKCIAPMGLTRALPLCNAWLNGRVAHRYGKEDYVHLSTILAAIIRKFDNDGINP